MNTSLLQRWVPCLLSTFPWTLKSHVFLKPLILKLIRIKVWRVMVFNLQEIGFFGLFFRKQLCLNQRENSPFWQHLTFNNCWNVKKSGEMTVLRSKLFLRSFSVYSQWCCFSIHDAAACEWSSYTYSGDRQWCCVSMHDAAVLCIILGKTAQSSIILRTYA